MPLNILLLPLLGGFLFLSIFRRTAYFVARQNAATLSSWLAVAGLMLLIVARIAVMICQRAVAGPQALAVPLLDLLLVPLLVLMAAGLALHYVTDLVRRRSAGSASAQRRPLWQIILGTALLAVGARAVFLIWSNAPAGFPAAHGIPRWIAWLLVFSVLLYAAARWAGKIRVDPASIVLRTALVGLLLLLLFTSVTFFPEAMQSWWLNFSHPTTRQISGDELGTSILAVLLGPVLAMAANFVYPRTVVEAHLFDRRISNSLERLFYRATRRAKMVMLTLDDGKVYCGYIDWIPGNPGASDAFLEIIPVFSGYRDSETKRVSLITSYAPFLAEVDRSAWDQFKKVVPLERISSAGEFDPEYFDAFAKHAAAPGSAATGSSADRAASVGAGSQGGSQRPPAPVSPEAPPTASTTPQPA